MLPDSIKKYDQALQQKKEILNNSAVMLRLSDLENQICTTWLQKPIHSIPERELIKLIGSIAKHTARDAGIKSGVDEYEMTRFMDILRKYYREFTIEEIKLSFELCVVGELDEYLPKDREGNADKNHYQVFSVEYITKVLNAYRKRKTEIWNKVYKCLPEPQHVISEAEKKEIDLSVRKQIAEKYIKYRDENVRPVFYVHIAIFAVLRDCGIITSYQFETSKESIEKAFREIFKDRTVSEDKRREALKYKNSGTIANILINRAGLLEYDKKIIEIFDKLIADKEDIEKLLRLSKDGGNNK